MARAQQLVRPSSHTYTRDSVERALIVHFGGSASGPIICRNCHESIRRETSMWVHTETDSVACHGRLERFAEPMSPSRPRWQENGKGGYLVETGIGVVELRTLRETALFVIAMAEKARLLRDIPPIPQPPVAP